MKIDARKLNIIIAKKGKMLKEIASASGLSENAFRNIRTGKVVPRLRTIGKIANALDVPIEEIIQKGSDD